MKATLAGVRKAVRPYMVNISREGCNGAAGRAFKVVGRQWGVSVITVGMPLTDLRRVLGRWEMMSCHPIEERMVCGTTAWETYVT